MIPIKSHPFTPAHHYRIAFIQRIFHDFPLQRAELIVTEVLQSGGL